MRVFLTGATGFIGSAIAENLKSHGHEVLGLAHSDEGAVKLRALGVEVVRGDLSDPSGLAEAARSADGVIHTAQSRDFATFAETDRAATQAMLAALEGTGKPFVYTSGTINLGDTTGSEADEDSPLKPLPFLAWRAEVEQQVLAATERGIKAVVVRPTLVYGRGGNNILKLLLDQARQSGYSYYVGTGENRWATIHVEDLAELYRLALEKAPAASILHGAGPVVTLKEIAEAISHLTPHPEQTAVWTPEEAVAAIGSFGSVITLDQNVSGVKTDQRLNWQLKGVPLLEDLARGSYHVLAQV